MSSETGNLVQFMFHTKFPFDCDKYARLCNLNTGYQYKLPRFGTNKNPIWLIHVTFKYGSQTAHWLPIFKRESVLSSVAILLRNFS